MEKIEKKADKNMGATFLGVDFGESNIGVALGRNDIVVPLEIIPSKNIQNAITQINRFVIENKVDKFVVGLPLTSDGKETKESLEVRKFARLLKAMTKRPADFQNEYGTSKQALEAAIELGTPENKRKTNDHLSAALILKLYFSENSETY